MWHRMKMRNNANKRSLTGAQLCLVLQEPFSSHDSYNQLKAEHKTQTALTIRYGCQFPRDLKHKSRRINANLENISKSQS